MAAALMLRPKESREQVLADLRQRFVALPDPQNETGWLIDLRDPFHPVVSHYPSWADAQIAADEMILCLLCTPAA